MEIATFAVLLLALGTALILLKLSHGRKRRKELTEAGRLSSWDDVEKHAERFRRIVVTNFGYGKEVWAITGNIDEMDLKLRAFKNGVLIMPRPDRSALESFCRCHNVALARTLVK